MGFRNGPSQTGGIFGDGDYMNMIIHEAITPDLYSFEAGFMVQDFQIKLLVIIREKNILIPVTALDNMMRRTRKYYPFDPWHNTQ